MKSINVEALTTPKPQCTRPDIPERDSHTGSRHLVDSSDQPDKTPQTTQQQDLIVTAEPFANRTTVSASQDTRSPTETVAEFLSRLPVDDPAVAAVGPWLWIHRPDTDSQVSWLSEDGCDAFMKRGRQLLNEYDAERDHIQHKFAGEVQSVRTRKLDQPRKDLQHKLLELATTTGLTCGKWMLFPNSKEVAPVWSKVAEATAAGKLGMTSKVATFNPSQHTSLVCVYTADFRNVDDVKRVLTQLADLGLCAAQGRPIYYKCDAYTYLDINSKNAYQIRASMYSSCDMLGRGSSTIPAKRSLP